MATGEILNGAALPRRTKMQFDECLFVFHATGAEARPSTMLDVGAHYGGSLRPFARAGWRVVAFEPDPANRARLEKMLALGPALAERVTVLAEAVSDEDGAEVPFFTSGVSTGISGLTGFHESHVASHTVHTVTLDTAIARERVEEIGFLKVDVEGHEMAVLDGLTMARHRPRAVLLEFEDAKTEALGYTVHDLAGRLSGQGYRVLVSEWHPIEEYGRTHSWARLHEDLAAIAPGAWGNLVALDPAIPDAALEAAAGAARHRTHPALAALKRVARKLLR